MPLPCVSSAVYCLIQSGFAVGYFAVPCVVYIGERPSIFEGCTCCVAADGCCVVPIGIERRVEIDQIDGFGVYASQDG